MLIGARIKKIRTDKGLTLEEFGATIGVSKVSVSGYEKGTRTPSLDTFIAIVEKFDVDPKYLLGYEVSIISEDEIRYGKKIATVDFDIITYLKRNPGLYNKIAENPKRTLSLISKIMKY